MNIDYNDLFPPKNIINDKNPFYPIITFPTTHPIVKEITIGNDFISYDGIELVLEKVASSNNRNGYKFYFSFRTADGNRYGSWYSGALKCMQGTYNGINVDVKQKYVSFKRKLNALQD